MARTCVYKRCVDAFLTEFAQAQQSITGTVVKEEPPEENIEDENTCNNEIINENQSGINSKLQVQSGQDSQEETNKENEVNNEEITIYNSRKTTTEKNLRKRAASSDDAPILENEQIHKKRRLSMPAIPLVSLEQQKQEQEPSDKSKNQQKTNKRTIELIQQQNRSRSSSESSTSKQYKCYVCNTVFKSVHRYTSHKFRYSSTNPVEYYCKTCNGWFRNIQKLLQHGRCKTTLDSLQFRCACCDKRFALSDSLRMHVFHVHPDLIQSGVITVLDLKQNKKIIVMKDVLREKNKEVKENRNEKKETKETNEREMKESNGEQLETTTKRLRSVRKRKAKVLNEEEEEVHQVKEGSKKIIMDGSEGSTDRVEPIDNVDVPAERLVKGNKGTRREQTVRTPLKKPSKPRTIERGDSTEVTGEIEAVVTTKVVTVETGKGTEDETGIETRVGTPSSDTTPTKDNRQLETSRVERLKAEIVTPPKKMRQLTLVECLHLSNKKKNDADTSTRSVDEGGSVPKSRDENTRTGARTTLFQENQQNRENQENEAPKQATPFVRIHADTTLLEALLKGCTSTIKTEPIDVEEETETHRRLSYSLRESRYTPRPTNRPRRRTMTGTNERKENNRTSISQSSNQGTDDCKSCYISLVKCDSGLDKVASGPKSSNEETLGKKDSPQGTTPSKKPSQDIPTPVSPVQIKRSPSCMSLRNVEIPLMRLDMDSLSPTSSEKSSPVKDKMDSPSTKDRPERQSAKEKPKSYIDPFSCKICKRTFLSKLSLREHTKQDHITYMSSICNARYSSRSKLLRHYLREHIVFKRDECCVCQETFDDPHMLKQHMRLHCIRTIRSRRDKLPVDVEIRCSSFRKRYQCSICGKIISLKSCLKQHEEACRLKRDREDSKSPKVVEDQEKKVSKEVPKESTQPQVPQLNQPTDIEHRTLEKCLDNLDESNKGSNSGETSQDEGETESDPNVSNMVDVLDMSKATYPCAVCGTQFRTFQSLCSHQRSYSQPACNQCGICGTAFTTKRQLQRHIAATHTTPGMTQGYKYHCKFCNQGFFQKGSLRTHEMHFHATQIHMAPVQTWLNREQVWNMNTICTVCNLMFENYDRYVEHNMYYYKETMFVCTFCNKNFQGLYMLHHHNKLVHYPEEARLSYIYTCEICSEGFNHESHFHAHKYHVHPNHTFRVTTFLPEINDFH